MTAMRGHVFGLLIAAVLAGPVSAESLELTPEGMRQAALLLLERGEAGQALRFATALLARDPQDIDALVLKSRAERDLGDYPAAVQSGRAAWQHASSATERHMAALAVAQGLASGDRRLAAQVWLRRALEHAPDAASRKAAARDLRYVRTRTRLALKFDLDLRPSSNVNGGSSARILEFHGIPLVLSPDARALSGWQGQVGVTGSFRLAESRDAKTDLRFGLMNRSVRLSDAAKAAAPMARGSDYGFTAVELGLDQAWKLPQPGSEVTLSGTFGQNWFGGEAMSRYGRLEFGMTRSLGPKVAGRLGLSAERQMRVDSADRSATVLGLSLGAMRKLGNGDRMQVSAELRDTRSDASDVDHLTKGLTLSWTKADPVMGIGLSASLGVTVDDFARSRYTSDGRHDLTGEANLSMAFETLDYMGFIPVMTLQAEKTRSNVSLYRSESVGIGFSIRSSF